LSGSRSWNATVRANAEVLVDRSHPETGLLNRKVIEDLLVRPPGTSSSLPERAGLERARSISAWVNDHGVALDR
jgi:asparagine synthase (glutamine-hydrolysing)